MIICGTKRNSIFTRINITPGVGRQGTVNEDNDDIMMMIQKYLACVAGGGLVREKRLGRG